MKKCCTAYSTGSVAAQKPSPILLLNVDPWQDVDFHCVYHKRLHLKSDIVSPIYDLNLFWRNPIHGISVWINVCVVGFVCISVWMFLCVRLCKSLFEVYNLSYRKRTIWSIPLLLLSPFVTPNLSTEISRQARSG